MAYAAVLLAHLARTQTKGQTMSKRLQDLQAKHAEQVARVKAIQKIANDENRDYTDEEAADIDATIAAAETVKSQIERETRILSTAATELGPKIDGQHPVDGVQPFKVPAKASARGNLKAFKGPDAERDAYASGQWVAATIFGNTAARDWCQSHGVPLVRGAHSTGDNSKGGYLVPDPMETAIIRLVEDYGVFRRNVGSVWPMPAGNVRVPKRNGGFTSYYVGENTAITASDMAFGNVQLTAKKLGVLTQISSELLEDSAVMLAEVLAQEFAYSFALAEDNAGFLGDGTSTYGGITGLKNALAAGAKVTTASNVDTFAELTVATLHEAVGKLPAYPGIAPKWYMSKACWANAFERLALAAGGNTIASYASGMGPSFMGYPVVLAQNLPSSTGDLSGDTFAYFGDLSMACKMGESRGITIATDTSKYFAEDSIAVRATERYDIVVHDVGDASVAGAVVALVFNNA